MNRDRPLIAHVLYRLDTGGMERVVVSLINATRDRYRHAVITLAGFGALRQEIDHAVEACVSLDKRPGMDWRCYGKFWRVLRELKPDLVQTYNIGTLDLAPIVKLAGVRHLVHAEHGRDAADPQGDNPRHQRLRRWMAPFIARHVVVSEDLQDWLTGRVGIRRAKVTHIANGIDTTAFRVARDRPIARPLLGDFAPPGTRVVVNVARLDKVKDHAGLIAAFKLLQRDDVPATDCRLVIAGEGPQRGALERQIAELDLARVVRLLGDRGDIAELLAESDVFALSSIAEGMPVTLLEAMAAGLPVAATDVGDVASVVADGVTGTLVPAHDPPALAAALGSYLADENRRRAHGDAARTRAMERFGLGAMVSAYVSLYDELLGTTHAAPLRAVPALTEHKEP